MQEKKKSKLNKAWENERKRENIKTEINEREKIMKHKKCWNTANKEKKRNDRVKEQKWLRLKEINKKNDKEDEGE